VCAVSLLGLISFSLVIPAVFTDADSGLPACCRRTGAHHCTKNAEDDQNSSSGTVVKAIRHACPSFPGATTLTDHSKTALPKDSQAIFATLLSHPAVQAQTEARYRVSFSRSHQKRGPPTHLS
jgi:hypothetical protein